MKQAFLIRRPRASPVRTQTVSFRLDRSDVGFYDNSDRFVVEPGTIDVYVGDSSAATLNGSFQVSP